MIRYKDYFDKNIDTEKQIIGLLAMGYEADEVVDFLQIDNDLVYQAIDKFAREQMNKMKFNGIMERLGYEYEKEETKAIFG